LRGANMPEIKSKKLLPSVNTFDFNFFADNKEKRRAAEIVAIVVTNSYIKLSLAAYKKLKGPEYFRVGIDVHNKVICVSPALKTEPHVFKPTAKQIERNTIFITKSRHVIKKLKELSIPKMATGMLVDGELLFKF
jgi:surface antigen (D15)